MDKKIIEAVLNIDWISIEIMNRFKDLQSYKIPRNSDLTKTVLNYNFIQICSLFDEIEIINSYSKSNESIRDIMWCISPLLKEIKAFTGIRKARNSIFAHYNRDRNNNFKPWWRALKEVHVPRSPDEIVFITTSLRAIRSIFVSRFINEVKELKASLKLEVAEYFEHIKSKELLLEIPNGINLVKQVQARLDEKNIVLQKFE